MPFLVYIVQRMRRKCSRVAQEISWSIVKVLICLRTAGLKVVHASTAVPFRDSSRTNDVSPARRMVHGKCKQPYALQVTSLAARQFSCSADQDNLI